MSELGGLDIGVPGEGGGAASEQLSEDAKQRFAAAAAAMQQIRREEKRSKKRDDQVAKAIMQFLSKDDYTHLFLLVSRLVARDCPSVFILAILSLIDEGALAVVQEYLKEMTQKTSTETVDENMALMRPGALDRESNRALIEWITRLQLTLALDSEQILLSLMIDERNVDGTVLQLTAFVIQDFFRIRGRGAEFEKIQPLAGSILQTVFEPYIAGARKKFLAERAVDEPGEQ